MIEIDYSDMNPYKLVFHSTHIYRKIDYKYKIHSCTIYIHISQWIDSIFISRNSFDINTLIILSTWNLIFKYINLGFTIYNFWFICSKFVETKHFLNKFYASSYQFSIVYIKSISCHTLLIKIVQLLFPLPFLFLTKSEYDFLT